MNKVLVIIPLIFLFLSTGNSQEQDYSCKGNYYVNSPFKLNDTTITENIKPNNVDRNELKKKRINVNLKLDENNVEIIINCPDYLLGNGKSSLSIEIYAPLVCTVIKSLKKLKLTIKDLHR